MVAEIRFKKGARCKAAAETVYNELERVRALGGGDLELSTLVDESRAANAPLHEEFTWANGEAAAQWRLQQARKVVQSLEVIHDKTPATRKYESVKVLNVVAEEPAKPKQVFRTVEDVLANPTTRADLLSQAIRDALAFKRRYAGLSELAGVIAAVDKTLDRMTG